MATTFFLQYYTILAKGWWYNYLQQYNLVIMYVEEWMDGAWMIDVHVCMHG